MTIDYGGFNKEAGDVLRLANQLARDAKQEYITSLCLLEAVLKHPENQARRVLAQMGHTPESILPTLAIPTATDSEDEDCAKRIITGAQKNAGTEDILLRMLNIDCLAGKKLNGLLINAERVKTIIFTLRTNPTPASSADIAQTLGEELAYIQAHICTATQNLLGLFEDANKVLRTYAEKQ